MKIKSITDVITNSSSECFTYITEESIDKVKNLINSILLIGGSSKTADELFIIKAKFDEGEVREYYDLNRDNSRLIPSNEELYEVALQLNRSNIEHYEGCPVLSGISIEPRDPELAKKYNKALDEINNLFKNEEFYV